MKISITTPNIQTSALLCKQYSNNSLLIPCIITVYVAYLLFKLHNQLGGNKKRPDIWEGSTDRRMMWSLREKKHIKFQLGKRNTTKQCINGMKDAKPPILLILSLFYWGKAAYFWLSATMKKDGRCAYKKGNRVHVSVPSSCDPLSLLLNKVMTAIATIDILTPKRFPWQGEKLWGKSTVEDIHIPVINFRHFSEGDALKCPDRNFW